MRPAIITWFRAYCVVLCILYLFVAAFSLVYFLGDPAELDMTPLVADVIGVLFLGMGLTFFAACLLPLLLRPRPWLWIYDMVIICLGMTSACFLPACIPLLIFWLKPETKTYFGRN